MLALQHHSRPLMSQKFVALNFTKLNFCLVTSKICYFKFSLPPIFEKDFSCSMLQNIFHKFDTFSWKIREKKGRTPMNFVSITFAQCCR